MRPSPTAKPSGAEVAQRVSLGMRIGATLLWAGALFFAAEATLAGELTFKLAAGGVAAALGTGIFLGTWFDAYVFVPSGVKHRRLPLWLTRTEPYVLRWDRPVYAFTQGYGFLGKALVLTNHDADDTGISVMDGASACVLLLREVRRNRKAFAPGRFEVADEFLSAGAKRVA
ncbi:MAG: hypothetical protein ABJF88_04430 [Rhodothermales bacterium]